MRNARVFATFCAVFGGALGCGQVLDIEEAHVDPALEAQAGSAGASAGSMAQMTSSLDDTGDASAASGSDAASDALCDQYCAAVVAGCTDANSQYIDLAACRASCGYYPPGQPGDTSGNSINCRLTYAQKASSEPYTYCTWAGPGGDGKCGSNCDGFCTIMMQTCTAESTGKEADYFASADDCQTTCAGLADIGDYSATNTAQQKGADDVQCRLYHVGAAVAEDDPTTHCPHAMGKSLCVNATAE